MDLYTFLKRLPKVSPTCISGHGQPSTLVELARKTALPYPRIGSRRTSTTTPTSTSSSPYSTLSWRRYTERADFAFVRPCTGCRGVRHRDVQDHSPWRGVLYQTGRGLMIIDGIFARPAPTSGSVLPGRSI